jgi:hypothetical protein
MSDWIGTIKGMAEPGFSAERRRQVTERDVELFPEMTGDRNPLHYDAEIAKRTLFGDLSCRPIFREAPNLPRFPVCASKPQPVYRFDFPIRERYLS